MLLRSMRGAYTHCSIWEHETVYLWSKVIDGFKHVPYKVGGHSLLRLHKQIIGDMSPRSSGFGAYVPGEPLRRGRRGKRNRGSQI